MIKWPKVQTKEKHGNKDKDENPDDLSPRDKKPSPSTSPTTSPETSDDELDQFHKELYHLCINKADDNGMILASQALKQKVIDLLGTGARELVDFQSFGPVLRTKLTLSGKSWKTRPENFLEFPFSGSSYRPFYWKTHPFFFRHFNSGASHRTFIGKLIHFFD